MSRASRRHSRTRVRSRTSRPHIEGLEARLAAGTVIDLFASTGAGLGIFGQPGEPRPSIVELAGPDSGQRPAVTQQSRFPVISSVVTSTAPEEVRRAPRSEPCGLSEYFTGNRHRPRPAPDGIRARRKRRGTGWEPLTPRSAAALRTDRQPPTWPPPASGAAGNRFGNLGGGSAATGSGGSVAGGGGVAASTLGAVASAAPRFGSLASSPPALAKSVATGAGGAGAAVQNVTGNRPGTSGNVCPGYR